MTPCDPQTTLAALLTEARARLATPREAVILLAHALGLSTIALYAHPEQLISADEAARARALITRRSHGEPMAYLTGERAFHELTLEVSPAVLIPRPETELLVELALDRLSPDKQARVLDLGTGSGAIALAIAHQRPRVHVTAVDRSGQALAVARANARRYKLTNVHFREGDWFVPIAGKCFDLIVSNPPYVAISDPHLGEGDLRFEPPSALVAGPDGLNALRGIIASAPRHLHPGGHLILEHGADQQPAVLDLLRMRGFSDCRGHKDLAGLPRAVSARNCERGET